MMNNADTPANPLSGDAYTNFSVACYHPNSSYDPQCQGLTKREHFAGLAMQGLLANSGGVIQSNNMSGTGWCNSDAKSMAELSVDCADALLAELAK